jgi:hypothetical protein
MQDMITQNRQHGGCGGSTNVPFTPEGCIVGVIYGSRGGIKRRHFVTGVPNAESSESESVARSGRGSHRHGQGTFRRGSSHRR